MPYFDHNATTPLLPEARAAWLRASDEAWANPSSPYRVSARVHRLLEEARERVAAHLAVAPEEIVFTSGATEANNAVINWAARALPAEACAIAAATEHPSVLTTARAVFGTRLKELAVASDGRVDPSSLAAKSPGFVAVMAANNETGVCAPVAEIAAACHEAGAWYLCDAAQWVGRLPARDLAPDGFIVGGAHKFGGPKGVGFLCVPKTALGAGFRAQLGGEQEQARRAGTENYAAIASMVTALEYAGAQFSGLAARHGWRARFIDSILRRLPGTQVNSKAAPCLWNTVSLCLPAHENTRWVVRLDKLGFEVSTGSACASGSSAPSHVLAAMGLSAEEARRTIRISSGWNTTEQDWDLLADAILNVWEQLQLDTLDETGGVIRL